MVGATVLCLLFLLAWVTSAVAAIPASRAFVGIFAQQALGTPHGVLADGLAHALLVGGLIGGLGVFCFNLFFALPRR
jgi:xanthine/uracil permease